MRKFTRHPLWWSLVCACLLQWIWVSADLAWNTRTKTYFGGKVTVRERKAFSWGYYVPGIGALCMWTANVDPIGGAEIQISAYGQTVETWWEFWGEYPIEPLIEETRDDIMVLRDGRGMQIAAFLLPKASVPSPNTLR